MLFIYIKIIEKAAYRVTGRRVVGENVRTCTFINAHVIVIDDNGRARVDGARIIGIPVSGDLVIATDVNAVEQLS